MTETSTELSVPKPRDVAATGLARYMPQDIAQLAWFANKVAEAGIYTRTAKVNGQNQQVPLNGAEAFLVMQEGAAMGLDPIASLREISVIENRGRKSTVASYRVIAARIQADPRTELFEWDGDDTFSFIRIKRRGRPHADTVRVEAATLPRADVDRHSDHLEDWLFARALRRLSKRGYADMVLGVYVGDELDADKIIDVEAVTREVAAPAEAPYGYHYHDHDDDEMVAWQLKPNTRTGGAFLFCPKCNATTSPPQEVRDAIRGTPAHFTIAAQESTDPMAVEAEPEVAPPPSEESAVQSETDGGAPDPDDVPLEPGEQAPPAQPDAYMDRWRANARAGILAHIRENRATQPQRERVGAALRSKAEWDGTTTPKRLVEGLSDEQLAALLGEFRIPPTLAEHEPEPAA